MVETEERGVVLGALKEYLEELQATGVDELYYAPEQETVALAADPAPAPAPAPAAAPSQPPRVAPPTQEAPSAAAPSATPASTQVTAAAPSAASAPATRPGATPPSASAAKRHCQGIGNRQARLVFVMRGRGFEGEDGALLRDIITKAMKMRPEEVYLLSFATISAANAAAIRAELLQELADIAPSVVVALGENAARLLLSSRNTIEALRGSFQEVAGIPVMPTLHPENLVADPSLKGQVWQDIKLVIARLGGSPR